MQVRTRRSLQQLDAIPIAASLVIFLTPPPEEAVTAGDLARSLAGDGRQVPVVDLPAGKAVRLLRRDGATDESASATLEVFVPVPSGGGWLLLSFSAPLGPLVPALAKLFDAICATLRWYQ